MHHGGGHCRAGHHRWQGQETTETTSCECTTEPSLSLSSSCLSSSSVSSKSCVRKKRERVSKGSAPFSELDSRDGYGRRSSVDARVSTTSDDGHGSHHRRDHTQRTGSDCTQPRSKGAHKRSSDATGATQCTSSSSETSERCISASSKASNTCSDSSSSSSSSCDSGSVCRTRACRGRINTTDVGVEVGYPGAIALRVPPSAKTRFIVVPAAPSDPVEQQQQQQAHTLGPQGMPALQAWAQPTSFAVGETSTARTALTAFVDGTYGSVHPAALEDETRPFAAISDALQTIASKRRNAGNEQQRWRVIVRPGVYARDPVIKLVPGIDIVGSGMATIVHASIACDIKDQSVSLSDMHWIVPAALHNVLLGGTLTMRRMRWEHKPSDLTTSCAFALGRTNNNDSTIGNALQGGANAVLQMHDTEVEMDCRRTAPEPIVPALFDIVACGEGNTASVELDRVRARIQGTGAMVGRISGFAGSVRVNAAHCAFDIVQHDAGVGRCMSLYMGPTSRGHGHLDWVVSGCQHTIRNGNHSAQESSVACIALGDGLVPAENSQFIMHQSLIRFVGYAPTAHVCSLRCDNPTASGLVHLEHNTWVGMPNVDPTFADGRHLVVCGDNVPPKVAPSSGPIACVDPFITQ